MRHLTSIETSKGTKDSECCGLGPPSPRHNGLRQGKTATCGVVLLRPRLLSRLPCAIHGGGARSTRYLGRQLFGSPRRKTACGSVARLTNQNGHFLPPYGHLPWDRRRLASVGVAHPTSTFLGIGGRIVVCAPRNSPGNQKNPLAGGEATMTDIPITRVSFHKILINHGL